MATPTKTRPKWFAPLILASILVSGLTIYTIYNTVIAPKPSAVTVTGTVTSATGLKVPELIAFTSLNSGSNFESYVSGGVSGTYAVTLPNGCSYRVTVNWASKGDGGSVDLGIFNLDSSETTIERDWVG